ncbi:MAG: phosphotransacetylase [Actinobacteria bacterium]|nr:phosphotransacetylase [Actinomycetota bacterium]MCG2819764.1 phosphotransacetylase [Actinomycetes bacterium]MBU4219268.1 phosphotransacetylase [Actinomycetota bacterium]MBU4359552.1 phosphotransacetylase [Actinomycetota bacterium]MBU4390842.1 phosphotransacetylase [Actinomycetota bacterium]
MNVDSLTRLTSPDITVGIGIAEGDRREDDVVSAADFCPLVIYRDAGALLDGLESEKIGAAVRGSLPAKELLESLAARRAGLSIRRIALVTLPGGKPFLLGPVGIDEGGTLAAMRALVGDAREFCSLLGWEPRVAVLSAGRAEDAGRSRDIARSIRRGERLGQVPGVRHYSITVEEAIDWANCVVAPDGVTGNLMYRTLTRLGAGSSLGALYFPLDLRLADTSRSGTVEEYAGAVALANIAVR